jgi:acid stress-induced BolA-like protein IbaG/YrbA
MLTSEQLKDYIMQGLPCDHVEVLGNDGQHFEAVIVSPAFVGKTMVQQHQLVYQALGPRMRGEIHALSMRTLTPEAWAQGRN